MVVEPVEEIDKRRRRRWASPLVLVLLILLGLALAAGAGAALWVSHLLGSTVERLDDPFAELDPATRPAPAALGEHGPGTRPVNLLILGSDSRISEGDPERWEVGAQRTDAIMLAHLTADGAAAQVVSIPRDAWVPIPGHGESKVNAAYSWGGLPLLVQTVESLTNVRIDHVAVIDFTSFATLTDALGGVTLGGQHLDGAQALAYVRERKSLPRGDFDRITRQHEWMRAVAASLAASKSDPIALARFVDRAARAVAVDEDFSSSEMLKLASRAARIEPANVAFATVPVTGTGTSPGGASIVNLDHARMTELMAALNDDTASALLDGAL